MPEGQEKNKISFDCVMACIYFVCLPLTVITTAYGSVLRLVTLPTVAILSVRLLLGKSRLVFNYVHMIYAVYVLYSVFQLSYFRTEISTIVTRDMFTGLLTLILISVRVYNPKEKEFIDNTWVVVGVICLVAAFTSSEVVSESEGRAVIKIFGSEEDQNQFCSYFIMPMIICIDRIIKKRKFKTFYMIMLLLIFYSVLKTGSRGGLVGLIFGALAFVVIGVKSVKGKIAVCLISVFVFFFAVKVVFPLLPESVTERFSVAAVVEDKASGRFEIWKYLINYTMEKPSRIIFGSGIMSTYPILFDAPDKTFRNGVAHNTPIQVFSDQGIIGLMLFLALAIACLARAARVDKIYACAFFSMLAFSMSLTFYVFKPCLNLMIMSALSFKGSLPEDILNKKERTDLI